MKKIVIIFTSIVGGILLMLYLSTVIVYNSIFNYRCTSETYLMASIDDFIGLERTRYEFNTRKDNKLVGYLYSNSEIEEKGLVVFAHGLGGGGQTGYIEIFNYLSSNGYYVFAYDATANDESEGKSVGGLPQGVIDLDNAINFTKTIDEVKDLPLMLMGFSWGAYSVSNVLNYQEDVKAVVAIAGWNESMNLIEYNSSRYVGSFSKVLLPFVGIHENIKYGKYASSKAIEGFENTDAKIMIVHSEDDKTVPITYGYDRYYEKYSTDDRFIFKHYTNRGHVDVFKSEYGAWYFNYANRKLDAYINSNKDVTNEDINDFVSKNTDASQLSNLLDYELFAEIIVLFNSCL